MIYADRNVEGVVEMMLDATKFRKKLNEERLFGWHAALFQLVEVCIRLIQDVIKGEMQVVSGAMGRRNSFSSTIARVVRNEMKILLNWINKHSHN
jgi:hypothetical protein